MKKKLISVMLIGMMTCMLSACGGEIKIVHCDNCGAEIKISAESSINEDWTLYCDECNKKLGIDNEIIDMLSE